MKAMQLILLWPLRGVYGGGLKIINCGHPLKKIQTNVNI